MTSGVAWRKFGPHFGAGLTGLGLVWTHYA